MRGNTWSNQDVRAPQHRGATGNSDPDLYERMVREALLELQRDGCIARFIQSARNSRKDQKYKADFTVWPTDKWGTGGALSPVYLQVKPWRVRGKARKVVSERMAKQEASSARLLKLLRVHHESTSDEIKARILRLMYGEIMSSPVGVSNEVWDGVLLVLRSLKLNGRILGFALDFGAIDCFRVIVSRKRTRVIDLGGLLMHEHTCSLEQLNQRFVAPALF